MLTAIQKCRTRSNFCALHFGLQILQIRKRDFVLQIVPGRICVNDSMEMGLACHTV